MKERLDVLVVSRGLAPSREKAKAIIMAGNVLVDGQREDKAGIELLMPPFWRISLFFCTVTSCRSFHFVRITTRAGSS